MTDARQERLLLERMMEERDALAQAVDAVANAAARGRGIKETIGSLPGRRHLDPFVPAAHRILADIAEQRRRLMALLDARGRTGQTQIG